MTALVSTSFAAFALYSFRSIAMAGFLDGCCDDFLLSDSEIGIFLPTNAPALKGIDAIVVMVPPRLALQCATLTTLLLFSLFLIATSTSLGQEFSFDAGEGSPARSGRRTRTPTRIPRTSWITSSGFMLAKLMAGSGLLRRWRKFCLITLFRCFAAACCLLACATLLLWRARHLQID